MITGAALTALLAWSGPSAAAPQQQTDQEALAAIREALRPAKVEEGTTAEEWREQMKSRADRALGLLTAFESAHPKSPALQEARALTLAALAAAGDEALLVKGKSVAERLKAGAAKGSDEAAQADLYLQGRRFAAAFDGKKSLDDVRAAWKQHAATIRDAVKEYLTAYPKYIGADGMLRGLVRMAERMGDAESRTAMLEAAAAARPDSYLAKLLARERAVGKEVDLKINLSGPEKSLDLKALRGKVVVITFWASWCAPCQKQLTELKKLAAEHGKSDLVVVGVSLDEKEGTREKYLKDSGIDWPQVTGEEARRLGREWAVDTIPFTLVIDRQGRLSACDVASGCDGIVKCLKGQ